MRVASAGSYPRQARKPGPPFSSPLQCPAPAPPSSCTTSGAARAGPRATATAPSTPRPPAESRALTSAPCRQTPATSPSRAFRGEERGRCCAPARAGRSHRPPSPPLGGSHAGYCSGDPALGGDCGSDIAEPSLACNGSWASCIPAAAAACDANADCNAFGLSPVWPALGPLKGTKLFSAGSPGLTANTQWATWVRSGHASAAHLSPDLDLHARARLLGGPGSGVTDTIAAPPAAGAGCTLELHYAPGIGGPWVSYPNATITPCASNNPAPWVLPNGTIYVVFTDQNMCVSVRGGGHSNTHRRSLAFDRGMWRAEQWQGPYTLVTTGVTAAGEDPSL